MSVCVCVLRCTHIYAHGQRREEDVGNPSPSVSVLFL